ncbi:MAG: glutathione peroxidase [Azoarcus sp.]|nr:glutathione peroxidase [Azoarcus sp.]
MSSPILDLPLVTLDGRETTLADHAGKVLLIVNTASQCGFTPQYAGLEKLYRDYGARGLVVLGFPCNQFGAQEPGTEAEIAAFCESRFGVSFPMFARIDVNGEHTHPLFAWLKENAKGVLGTEAIKWNFTKFLVDRSATRVTRYAPTTTPESLVQDIEGLLD